MYKKHEDNRRRDFVYSYYHFNQRLLQRYGIELTIDEYIDLCAIPVSGIRKDKQKKVGVLKIKDVDVVIVKEIKNKRRLITALPKTTKFAKWVTGIFKTQKLSQCKD